MRVVVVGAGAMGANHIRAAHLLPNVDLVAVVDPSPSPRARQLAANVPILSGISELPDADFAVVATPTPSHHDVALGLIRKGLHVLIEKPLASTYQEAAAIHEAASAAGVSVGVGHIERFNPAFSTLKSLVSRPLMISFERLSPYTPRIGDSVVMDLMVHDLDLAVWLMGEMPTRVSASGAAIFSSDIDIASATLEFEKGGIVTLQASRATQDKVRRVSISEPDKYTIADSIRQDIQIKRETTVEFVGDDSGASYRQANIVEIPYLDRSGEPLLRQLEDFSQAIRDGRSPSVSIEAGMHAVKLALLVEQSIAAKHQLSVA